MRKYQYKQFKTLQTTIQPFSAVSATTTTTKTTSKPTRTNTKYEGQCFYCGKTGHRKSDCGAKQRDEVAILESPKKTPSRRKKRQTPTSQNTTPNWSAKHAITRDIRLESADVAYIRRAALHTEKSLTPRTYRKTIKTDDRT